MHEAQFPHESVAGQHTWSRETGYQAVDPNAPAAPVGATSIAQLEELVKEHGAENVYLGPDGTVTVSQHEVTPIDVPAAGDDLPPVDVPAADSPGDPTSADLDAVAEDQAAADATAPDAPAESTNA